MTAPCTRRRRGARRAPRGALPLAFLLASGALGCAGGDPGAGPARPADRVAAPRRGPPTQAELERLLRMAEAVVVATVEGREETQQGVRYRLRPGSVVRRAPTPAEQDLTHPIAEGEPLEAASFLFRPGQPGAEIGRLDELSRYVFFLSPTDVPGRWLHLDDPAAYRLPDAEATLEQLRAIARRMEEAAEESRARAGGPPE